MSEFERLWTTNASLIEERAALLGMAETANAIIAEKINHLDGVYRIFGGANYLNAERDPLFDEFRAIDTEADICSSTLKAACSALLAFLTPRIAKIVQFCFVCGFCVTGRPPYDVNGNPSYEDCPACGYYYGIDSDRERDFRDYRESWLLCGMPFAQPPPPAAWNPIETMRACRIPIVYMVDESITRERAGYTISASAGTLRPATEVDSTISPRP